jgi:flagella basal body P-ring formation protein FlgA
LLVAIAVGNPSTANTPQTPRDQAKQQLIDQVEEWVSTTEDVERSRIRVGALDRRLIVPPCDADFTMSYPFASSTESIRVDCKGTGWKAFLRVRVESASQGYAYKRDLSADHALTAEDIELISIKGRQQGLVVKLEDIGNMSLKKIGSTWRVGSPATSLGQRQRHSPPCRCVDGRDIDRQPH